MSSLDQWIIPYTKEYRVATIATSATLAGNTHKPYLSSVAGGMRQSATSAAIPSNVAHRCNDIATENTSKNQFVIQNVAEVAIVAGGMAAWDLSDWQEFYNERAGIAEHCGMMPQDDAECMAYESCITRWLNTHPPAHTNDAICPHCHKPNGAPGASSIPTLTGNGGHLWLHHDCLEPWLTQRQEDAITALISMGIRVAG